MVVETAGGKKEDSKIVLPGYADIAVTPCEVAAVPVKGGKKDRHSSFFYLLLVCVLIGTSIYFGVMSEKYKKNLNGMKMQCGTIDGLPLPNRRDGPDGEPNDPNGPKSLSRPKRRGGNRNGRPRGGGPGPQGGHGNDDNDDFTMLENDDGPGQKPNGPNGPNGPNRRGENRKGGPRGGQGPRGGHDNDKPKGTKGRGGNRNGGGPRGGNGPRGGHGNDDDPKGNKGRGGNRNGGGPRGGNGPRGGHGNDDDIFDTIAEILKDCITIEDLNGGIDLNSIGLDGGCIKDKWSEIKEARKGS